MVTFYVKYYSFIRKYMSMESRVLFDFLCGGFFPEKNRFKESSCIVSLEEGNFHMDKIEECYRIHK